MAWMHFWWYHSGQNIYIYILIPITYNFYPQFSLCLKSVSCHVHNVLYINYMLCSLHGLVSDSVLCPLNFARPIFSNHWGHLCNCIGFSTHKLHSEERVLMPVIFGTYVFMHDWFETEPFSLSDETGTLIQLFFHGSSLVPPTWPSQAVRFPVVPWNTTFNLDGVLPSYVPPSNVPKGREQCIWRAVQWPNWDATREGQGQNYSCTVRTFIFCC